MISREDLYELVWSKPMTKVAEQFDVSGSYMARVCSILNVPRPERGYWAKLAVGKAPARQPLPEARPGDQLTWSRDSEFPLPPKPHTPIRRQAKAQIQLPQNATHGLIRGARQHFETGRPVDDGTYLKPYKKLLVDVTASKECLGKALAFANELFNTLETSGHRVVLAPPNDRMRRGDIDEREERTKRRERHYYSNLWSPWRPTVVYVGTVAIGLAVVEMSESVLLRYVSGKYIREADYKPPKVTRYHVDHSWTTTRDLPSGRLRLIAYSPYWRVSWSTDWQETRDAPLGSALPVIIGTIKKLGDELVGKLEEADRQAEIERRRWLAEEERRRREEDRRRVDQSVRDSQAQLGDIIQKWANRMSVERFLAGVEERLSTLPEDERERVRQRLELAREFLGVQDPMDFFLSWQTPSERYSPLYSGTAAGAENANTSDEERQGRGNLDSGLR